MNVNEAVRADDFPLQPVPGSRQIGWVALTIMRFGQFATLAQLLVGSSLGATMTLPDAFLALVLGCVILLLVALPMGLIGQQTSLATSVLTRSVGLKSGGSAVFSLISGIAVMGWFGVQNALFAEGVHALVGRGPLWIWTMLSGLLVTLIVSGGILRMGWTAYVSVPLFVGLLADGVSHALAVPGHGFSAVHLSTSLPVAITIVVGSFILGAVLSPDLTRFQKNSAEVAKQTVVSFVLGVGLISGIGIIAGHALDHGNITTALAETGIFGWVLFVSSTIKVSDWDIYGASLALVNGLDLLGLKRVDRRAMTWLVGAVGTAAGVLGIVSQFEPFLTLLGVAIPPVAAIVIIDYWTRPHPSSIAKNLGGRAPWPMAVAWAAGIAAGHWLSWGVPALNSLVAASLGYGMLRLSIGRQRALGGLDQ